MYLLASTNQRLENLVFGEGHENWSFSSCLLCSKYQNSNKNFVLRISVLDICLQGFIICPVSEYFFAILVFFTSVFPWVWYKSWEICNYLAWEYLIQSYITLNYSTFFNGISIRNCIVTLISTISLIFCIHVCI